jgi:hypothetical protein
MRAALLVALTACGAHVQLPAPSPGITPADRVAMFKALERANQEVEQVSVNNGPWQLKSSTLILANGTRVEHADDLLPVVPPDSDTAKLARASATARHRSIELKAVAYGAAVVGMAVLVSSFNDDVDVAEDHSTQDYIFIGTAIAAAVPYLIGLHEQHEEIALRMQAFSTYTRDLGVRLDVCAHGLEVVACETVPSAYPPANAPNAPSPYPAATTTPAPAPPPPTTPAPAENPIVDPFARQPAP